MTDGLLLLHAFPLDASMWSPQVQALGAELPVVAPNVPGFGGSAAVGDVTSMDVAADVAASALDEAGIDRAVVVGLSMGGYVALSFWRRHRPRISGLVLANTRAGGDDEAGRGRRAALARRLRAEGSDFLVAEPGPLLSADAPEDLWARVRAIVAAQPAESIAAAALGMAERADSTPGLGGIDVPTLIVTSTADALIPAAATSPMAGQIPGAGLEVIEGAGHLSNLEAAPTFTALLRTHLVASGTLAG